MTDRLNLIYSAEWSRHFPILLGHSSVHTKAYFLTPIVYIVAFFLLTNETNGSKFWIYRLLFPLCTSRQHGKHFYSSSAYIFTFKKFPMPSFVFWSTAKSAVYRLHLFEQLWMQNLAPIGTSSSPPLNSLALKHQQAMATWLKIS